MPRLGEHASPFRMGAVVHPTAPAAPCDDADAPEQRPDTSDAPQPWHQTPRDSRPRGEYAGSEGPAEATGHAESGHITCRMAAPRRPERFPNCRRIRCAVQDARDKRCGSGRRRGAIRPRPATTKLRSPKRQAPVSALRQTEFATTLQRAGQERARWPGWRDRCFLACAGSVACAGTMSTRVAVPYRRQRRAHAPTAGRPPTRAAHMQCGVRAPRRLVPLRIAAARWPGCSGMDFGILRRTRVHSRLPHRQTVQNPLRPSRHVWWRPSQLKFLPAGSAVMRYGCRFGRNGAPEWQFVITFIIVYSLYS